MWSERSYLVTAVGESMARRRPQRCMGENFDLNLPSGTKETQHRWVFIKKKPPFPDFTWFDNFLKTASKYPFLKALLSKVEFIMVSRWVCFDLIYCHHSSNSSIIWKVSFTHLCVYQKTTIINRYTINLIFDSDVTLLLNDFLNRITTFHLSEKITLIEKKLNGVVFY